MLQTMPLYIAMRSILRNTDVLIIIDGPSLHAGPVDFKIIDPYVLNSPGF